MATLKELMGNLTRGDGRVFANVYWDEKRSFEPIYLAEGVWYGIDRKGSSVQFEENLIQGLIQGFYEVKRVKKIKLYKPIFNGYRIAPEREDKHNGAMTYTTNTEWHSDKGNWRNHEHIKGWLELECEVEE